MSLTNIRPIRKYRTTKPLLVLHYFVNAVLRCSMPLQSGTSNSVLKPDDVE